ncbi:MAG: hypothetical protein P4L74_06875 [Candidatus Doudnabacteria bacterium]|nr:hypothetical protein [Candidatus Doudnabacteria bacterium]
MEGFGNPQANCSFGDNRYSETEGFSGTWDVMATAIISGWLELKAAEEIIKHGLCLKVERSVYGKGIKMTSPGL